GRMSVRTTMLGRRWSPYRYDDDEPVPPLPDWLVRAARSALEAASTVDHRVATDAGRPLAPVVDTPGAALVNVYGRGSTLGLRTDVGAHDHARPALVPVPV